MFLGTGEGTKADEFLEKFQGGGVIFNPKINIADFGPSTGLFRKNCKNKGVGGVGGWLKAV